MSSGIRAERLFADLCNRYFLRGFVFHSPRFFNPSENEAGDIVLWVRRQVVVFEVLARDVTGGPSTKQFVKRIGEKREQLLKDYRAFTDLNIDIRMVNEQGEKVVFDKRDLAIFGFSGIVIVDCDSHIEKLHFGTIQKSLALPFPIAIMSRQDFLDLTAEVDTVPDLTYYLLDRFEFLQQAYESHPQYFLDLNSQLERNLIAFYKTHENKFPIDAWKQEKALDYYSIYTSSSRDTILARNAENTESFIIDKILDLLRLHNTPTDSTLLHSWELATMTRRQRAGWLSEKIRDAIERMLGGNPKRHFAFFNEVTGCWLVFYFRHGGSSDEFKDEVEILTKYKLLVEMKERDFEYSVFGYGFRKSFIETGATFDELILRIEDADDYSSVPEREYKLACQYFGKLRSQHIREFPT
jgi:hypothetical protein